VDVEDNERKILDILVRNASRPNGWIASQLDLNPEEVKATVDKLVSGGIIRKFTAILDPKKVGFMETAYLFVESEENYPRAVQEATVRAKEWGGVESFYIVFGDKDVIVRIIAHSSVDIDNFATNALLKVSWFEESETYLVTHRVREWGIDFPPQEQAGAMEVPLTDLDRSILRELQADCREKNELGQLGTRLGCPSNELGPRISDLERAGVIRGYTALLDPGRLGIFKATMFLNLRRGWYHKVTDALLAVENGSVKKDAVHVPFIVSGLGQKHADICVGLAADSFAHLDVLTDAIREIEGIKSSIVYLASKVLIEDTCVPV
jgi:Lrp/AsnC family transcriptional regulator for asnA, asnC and gidA